MKILITVVLALIVAPLLAQKNNQLLPIEDKRMEDYLRSRKIPELKIRIINSAKSIGGTSIKYSVVHLGAGMQTTNYTAIDDKATAVIKLTENLPYQQVWLTIDDYLYTGVLVNSSLEIIIDAGKIKKEVYLYGDGITFKGADAGLNEALCKRVLFKKSEEDELSNKLVQASLDAANGKLLPHSFLTVADSIYQAIKKIDDAYLKEDRQWSQAIKNETDSRFYSWVVVALRKRDSATNKLYQRAIAHQPYFMSNDGVGFYRNLMQTYAFAEDKTISSLQDLLYSKYDTYTKEQQAVLDSIKVYEPSPAENKVSILRRLYTRRYKLLKTEVEDADFKLFILRIEKNSTYPRADILKLQLMEVGKDYFGRSYPMLLGSMKTAWTKQVVQSGVKEFTARQEEVRRLFQSTTPVKPDSCFIGKPVANLSFGALLYKLDSIDNIDRFLTNLKSKFSGKALIIDIWATWCGPCITDITNSKKLHEECKDLPVEYIYLCTTSGSDEESWKSRIGILKPFGTHIFIDQELEAALRKKLNADGGYPTYVVIDQNGIVHPNKISFMSNLNREKFRVFLKIENACQH